MEYRELCNDYGLLVVDNSKFMKALNAFMDMEVSDRLQFFELIAKTKHK